MRFRACLFVVAVTSTAGAGPLKLEPYKGTDLTVSFPKGWKVEQQSGIYIAQQDPTKKDSAGVMFIYMPNANNASEDQLLDAMTSQVAQNIKVTKKAAIPGGAGHYAMADGTADGAKVPVPAIAVVARGQWIVS